MRDSDSARPNVPAWDRWGQAKPLVVTRKILFSPGQSEAEKLGASEQTDRSAVRVASGLPRRGRTKENPPRRAHKQEDSLCRRNRTGGPSIPPDRQTSHLRCCVHSPASSRERKRFANALQSVPDTRVWATSRPGVPTQPAPPDAGSQPYRGPEDHPTRAV